MINKDEVEEMAEALDVHTSHVQRDYVHGWIASRLFAESNLADRLALKGGNSLRKGYFVSARYSRDLDFTTPTSISHDELHAELNKICESITLKSGIDFDLSRTSVGNRKSADKEKQISEARLYFNDFYGNESSLVLAVRLDVTQFDRIHLPVQSRQLIHPYSDADICSTPINCVKLEEILASKLRCLLQRRHIADLFDLVYGTIINPSIEINRSELLSTFFRITIFGSRPAIAKGLFLELAFDSLGALWERFITCPLSSRFDFSRAKDSFLMLIEQLMPGHAETEFDPIFFPAALRNQILAAAESQTLLRLTYDGVERLIEPYELTYKIRKDNVGREYFYAYDQTGGRNSGPSLKTFVSQKVQRLESTDISFEPRTTIELNKAGSSETVSRFEGKSGRRSISSRSLLRQRKPKRPSRRLSYNFASPYRVECYYCQKRFNRKKPDTKLNPHKDKFGNKCFGKRGYLV